MDMKSSTLRPFLCFVMLGASASGASAQAITSESLAQSLEQWMSQPACFETTWHVYATANHDPEGAPVARDDWFSHETVKMQVHDDRICYRRTIENRQTRSQERELPTEMWFWNGTDVATMVVDSNAITLTDAIGAGDTLNKGWHFNRLDGRYPSFPSLAEMVREGTMVESVVENDVLRYHFRSSWSDKTHYEVFAQLKPRFELRKVVTIMGQRPSTEASFGDDLLVRQSFEITDWIEFEGQRVPAAAEVVTWSARSAKGTTREPSVFRAWYEREDIKPCDECSGSDEKFQIPYREGLGIVDQRINLSFVVGKPSFVLDGIIHQVEEPLREHPREMLGQLVAGAERMVPPQRANTALRNANGGVGDKTVGSWIWLVSAVCLLFGGGVLLWPHLRKSMKQQEDAQ